MIWRQQSQKWIKLQKILVTSLLCFKATEIKMHLLPYSIWKTIFLLFSIDLKSFQFNRLSKIWIRESCNKLIKKLFLNKKWSRKKWIVFYSLNKLLTLISTAKSTLIFWDQSSNWLQKGFDSPRYWLKKL